MDEKKRPDIDEIIAGLREALEVQTQDGVWNYEPYQMGLANGMKIALALLEDNEPEFLKPPKEWIRDRDIKDSLSQGFLVSRHPFKG